MIHPDIPTLAPACPDLPAPDLRAAVHAALAVVDPRRPLTLLVNDPQRHTDTPAVLRALADEIDPAAARVLVATGSHAFDAGPRQAHERRLHDAFRYKQFAWHDCRAGDLVPIGSGRVWRGHPWLADAGALLAIGSVEPHYFAGFTGAHKTCTIGCAAHDDIQDNHAAALSPDCAPTRLIGNPVHQGVTAMLQALAAARPVAAVNVVQAGDRILAAAGGTPLDSLEVLAPIAAAAFTCRLDAPADAVVAEVAGPLGRCFYQADKGIKNTESAVRDGGALVLVAPCPDGIGQDHFVDLLRRAPTHAEALAEVRRRGYRLGDHKAVRLRHLTDPAARNVRVWAVAPGLSPADAAVLGLRPAATVAEALAQARLDPARHQIVHLRDAGNTCITL